MRPRVSSSARLALSVAILSGCVIPNANLATPNVPTPAATIAPGTCEYFGASFRPPAAWKVEEHAEPNEPVTRVSLTGLVSGHQILLSIIPRALRSGPTDKKSQADAYFAGLRGAMTEWTNVRESTMFDPAGRSYAVASGTRIVKGSIATLDTQQDDSVLLYFPADFPQGRYFYVFFWTDIHLPGSAAVELDVLRSIVDSFAIRSSPTTASKGCVPS